MMGRLTRRLRIGLAWSGVIMMLGAAVTAAEAGQDNGHEFPAGVAKVDITPTEPIRLTGYASRSGPSEGVAQKLWAKALALGEGETLSVLVTIDNCGIAESTYRTLRQRLETAFGLRPERVVFCLSHTHSGPCTTDWAPNIFVRDMTVEEQTVIDRYTTWLMDRVVACVGKAIGERRPGRVEWSRGKLGFARNRRPQGGPVDHDLPVVRVVDDSGEPRAIVANYACHCTTLGGGFNQVCGDWVGFAAEQIEARHPGAVALLTIGCGADANPHPRGGEDGGLALARQHGRALAEEVERLSEFGFFPLNRPLEARIKEVALPFANHFTRAEWEVRAGQDGIVGYHARKNLARLDRGESLPDTLYYPIVTWNFGEDMAWVFLPGEVVVDYAVRLKSELDRRRLIVTAYANYVPCYIPSRRILREGGYEAEGSLWYYDRPGRLAPATEEIVIDTVHELVPDTFAGREGAAMDPPPTVEQSLRAFQTHRDLTMECVAAEPLVASPVAIDWDDRGELWVCEMFDYPSGAEGGGRVVVLSDSNDDGIFDRRRVFLEGLRFPTGVTCWEGGALICAAPEILYAKDQDGDGKADEVEVLATGFATHNYQARVNGFSWGLDGWWHGSSGLFGGVITNMASGQTIDLRGRDFRWHPGSKEIEPLSGISQMGRVRNDAGQWFGNDNGTLLWHYPLEDAYLRRNPHVPVEAVRYNVAAGPDPNQLHPISRTLERFNDPEAAQRVTSACGPCLYRDHHLGSHFQGDAFVCEPVHNLVRRLDLRETDGSIEGRRAPEELTRPFLASRSSWFRPVQVRTGPDGALWVVDMQRWVVEHPRWISAERLATLDVRAGAERGRIYRLFRRGSRPELPKGLEALPSRQLAKRLDTGNGPLRDRIQQIMMRNGLPDQATRQALRRTSRLSPHAGARLQALHLMASLNVANGEDLRRALDDADPAVRTAAIRLAEGSLSTLATPDEWQARCHNGPWTERLQLALSLGQEPGAWAAGLLDRLLSSSDPWVRMAGLSSAGPHAVSILRRRLDAAGGERPSDEANLVARLVATITGRGVEIELVELMDLLVSAHEAAAQNSLRWAALAELMSATPPVAEGWSAWAARDERRRELWHRLDLVRREALPFLTDESAPLTTRKMAVKLAVTVARPDVASLVSLLQVGEPRSLQEEVLGVLRSLNRESVAAQILQAWHRISPALRPGIMELLLSRDDGVKRLLRAVEAGEVAAVEVPLHHHQRLRESKDEDISALAGQLLAGRSPGQSSSLLKRYTAASGSGSADRGRDLFDRACASCHVWAGRGHVVGPDLREYLGKAYADFVLAVLRPNAALNPNHLGYEVRTRDGRQLTGLIREEAANSLQLLQAGGIRETLLRQDVASVRALDVSLMPEGLEAVLTASDLADLWAWLHQGK